jgi:hypothetical protein
LTILRETWGLSIEQPDNSRILLKKVAAQGLWGSLAGKKHGLEVQVRLPSGGGRSAGEILVTGTTFGTPDATFQRVAADVLPKIITDVRRELQNVEDRRKHPRIAIALPLSLYPIHADGSVDPAILGRCRDVSGTGVCFSTAMPLTTKYMYMVFDRINETAGLAILARLVRHQSQTLGNEHHAAVQFRTDL